MTASKKAIRFRWNNYSQPNSGMVKTFNFITQIIDECGMVRLSDEEFIGQSGTFVEEAPGVGETVIDYEITTNLFDSLGYNVWKHPNKNLYIKVNYLVHGNINDRFGLCVSYEIGTEISGGVFVGETINVRPLSNTQESTASSYKTSPEALLSKYLDCFAYMDEDCFWIGSEPQVITLDNSSHNTRNSLTRAPTNISPLSFGVFYSETGNICVIYSQAVFHPSGLNSNSSINGSGSYNGYSGGELTQYFGHRTIRCYLKSGEGSFQFQNGLPICTFNNSNISSDKDGVRVTQAQAIISGNQNKFDIGFINGAAAPDLSKLYVDLDGSGEKPYKVMKSFGSATPDFCGSTLEDIAVLLLPWSE